MSYFGGARLALQWHQEKLARLRELVDPPEAVVRELELSIKRLEREVARDAQKQVG